ncbi:MAG: response regulator transcription factor [Pseudomonadota bacterium]
MKILLIEDDLETADYIGNALQAHGHEVEKSRLGSDGLAKARIGQHAALILDRRLPGLDGLSVVKQLRADRIQIPVLFLTTMSGIDDRVEGLNGGGDDYLAKPFAVAELLARVNALARRSNSAEPVTLKVGDLEMDLIRRTLRRESKTINLSTQEFKLLEYMLRNAGLVVTRNMLLENVWKLNFDPYTNVVETHMSRLRSKMDRGYKIELIRTIHRSGYMLHTD